MKRLDVIFAVMSGVIGLSIQRRSQLEEPMSLEDVAHAVGWGAYGLHVYHGVSNLYSKIEPRIRPNPPVPSQEATRNHILELINNGQLNHDGWVSMNGHYFDVTADGQVEPIIETEQGLMSPFAPFEEQ